MNQYNEFIQVLKALEEQKVDYILIGGFAVFLHGFRRFTEDIDLFIKMIPENVEHLRKALHSVFQDSSINEITLDELTDYPVIRYGTPDNFYIDIISRLGEMAAYEDLEYETIDYQGVKIKIATPETLFDLKKDTVRPQDKQDAMFLHELIKNKKK
ncbi:MAG: hypothetical protein GY754_07540 [bacterium]|nr:hypothetical protein [bacterium]